MQYGVILTGVGPMAETEKLIRAARKADALGFHSLWLYEHIAFPARPAEAYGKLPFTPEMKFLAPVATLAYLAAETRQIRLGTGILLLALRHPLHVAKEIATLDVLSKGRVILGVGLGWLAEEFDALGVPFRERAGRVRESVEVLRTIWAGGRLEHRGRYYSFPEVTSYPQPVQPGGPPIWFGGSVDQALRRAAELGDGWIGTSGRPDKVEQRVALVRKWADELGKKEFAVAVAAAPEMTREEAERFARVGVNLINLTFASGEAEDIERKMEDAAKRLMQ
jgi:probable F420-dependent oxidoreductase